eukprot:TRINITY_DN12270_c0_g1_i1.p1 TRINITY_DN12270_c0_g1~~TRINITY_DN12270_c0_g1_i1.p1  ORF type:complete len:560 (-),score=56.96 TRINITY_DN12270_c0_g1_i1:46-1560(-)
MDPLFSFDDLIQRLAFVHNSLVVENKRLREQCAVQSPFSCADPPSPMHMNEESGTTQLAKEETFESPLTPVVEVRKVEHEPPIVNRHNYWRERLRQTTSMMSTSLLASQGYSSGCEAFVRSGCFESFVGVLIVLNCFVASMEQQYEGFIVGIRIGAPGLDRMPWILPSQFFSILEIIFVTIFTLELVFRISVLRRSYFHSWSNAFDTMIVLIGLLSLVLPTKFLINPNFSRVFRSAKFLRGLRLVIQHRSADSLKMLLKSLSSCFTTLGWSFLLLSIVQVTASLLMTQLVRRYLETTNDMEAAHLVYSYFGTFTLSWLTMHEIFLANWGPACRVLIENVSEYFSIFFILYRCVLGFAVLNVINAVFVQQTMRVAEADKEMMIMQKQRAKEDYVRKLGALFKQLDVSGDGSVSWDEFCCALADPGVKNWMNALEIEGADMRGLFMLLDDGDGEINIDDFVKGASRLKGPAKSIDLAFLISLVTRVETRIESIAKRVCFSRGITEG